MLKIKLNGMENEVNAYLNYLREDKNIKIVNKTELLKVTGKTIYGEISLEIEFQDPEKKENP